VREADPQAREALQDAAHKHRHDGRSCLSRHAHQPGQPVFGVPPAHLHVPWVHEEAHVKVLQRLVNRVKLGRVQVPFIYVRADLEAGQAQVVLYAFDLLDG